jgi:hypothetical protein
MSIKKETAKGTKKEKNLMKRGGVKCKILRAKNT